LVELRLRNIRIGLDLDLWRYLFAVVAPHDTFCSILCSLLDVYWYYFMFQLQIILNFLPGEASNYTRDTRFTLFGRKYFEVIFFWD